MALTIADFLKHVRVSRYKQAVGTSTQPSAIVDGVPQGWYTTIHVASFVETVFEFEGVRSSMIPSSGTVSVTDASGNTYSVSFADSVTVQGTAMFETSSNKVYKENISPRLWRVTVVHREGSLVT